MSQKSTDLRVRRTRKLLREAVLDLIEERGFVALTVGEIAERAMVSRAAFYRYYQDKYDLVEQIFAEALQVLVSSVDRQSHASLGDIDPQTAPTPQRWVTFFEHIADYERLYRVLLSGKGNYCFAIKMRAILAEMRNTSEQENSAPAHGRQTAHPHQAAGGLAPALVDALIVDTVAWWLEQGRPYSPQQIAAYCWRMIIALLKEANTWL